MTEWKYYFPGNGETAEDACSITENHVRSAMQAAQFAREFDYSVHDGWEAVRYHFIDIVVISPDGKEERFVRVPQGDGTYRVYACKQ